MMRFIRNSILALFFAIVSLISLTAQPYNMPYRGKLEITAGESLIYDNGGNSGNYADNSSDTLIIRPGIPGTYVKLSFEQLYLDSYSDDYIEIYSSDTLRHRFDFNQANLVSNEFISHDSTGAMMIVFVSDESGSRSGFRFNYSTIDHTPQADFKINSLTLDKHETTALAQLQANTSILNLGPDKVYYYSIDYYLSNDTLFDEGDRFLNAYTLPGTSVGSMYSDTYTCTLDFPEGTGTGTYYILGRITNVAGDYDHISSNSCKYAPIDVVEPYYDFRISRASVSSNLLSTHTPFTITFDVENRGNEALLQGLTTGFFLSTNEGLDEGDLYLGESTLFGIGTTPAYWNHIIIDSLDLTSTPEGIYYLIAACDYENSYSESNEDNNYFITQVAVLTSKEIRENLILNSMQPAVDTLSSGQPIKVKLQASTTIDSHTPTIDFYLSADSLFDEGDQLLKSYDNKTFYPSGTIAEFEITCYVNEEEGIPEGHQYLIAVLDGTNQILEFNETDNTRFAEVYVSKDIIKDLGFGEISLNCDSLLNNHWLNVYASVTNFGSSKSVLGRIYCYLSDDEIYDSEDLLIAENYFNYFEPGSTITRSLYYPDLHLHNPGNYHIIVRLDPLNEVDEVNEGNNFGVIPLKLLDPADVDRLDAELLEIVAPDTVAPGSSHQLGFRCIFYNDERASLNAAIYLSKDTVLDSGDLSSRLVQDGFYCSALQETEIKYNYKFDYLQDTGKFYLIVKLDDYNYLAEDDEDNNLLIKPLHIYQEANNPEGELRIRNTTLNSSILCSSNKLEGNVTVLSEFGTSLDTAFIEFYISEKDASHEELVLTKQLFDLRYSSEYVQFSIDLPTGIQNSIYKLHCHIRTSHGAIDINPMNNEDYAYFFIQDVDLDFSIDQLFLNKEAYHLSDMLNVSFEVRNNGTTSPSTPGCSYYISTDPLLSGEDLEIEASPLQDLGIQHTQSISKSLNLPQDMEAGSYYLIVALDAENTYPESNEENNLQYVPFKLLPNGPNLIVQSTVLNTHEIATGVQFSAYVSIANTGNIYANSSSAAFYLSNDSTLSESDIYLTNKYVTSISAGSQVEYQVYITPDASIDPGPYYLLVVADMYEKIIETDESDNVLVKSTTIVPPSFDLEITGSNIQDTLKTSELSNISLSLNLINHGEHAILSSFKIYSYISTDSIFDLFGDTYVGNADVRTDFNPGSQLSTNITSYLPEIVGKGQYWLFYFLDAEGDIDEINETNNVFHLPVVITDLDVDIAVTGMDLAPDTIPINTRVTCNYTVANIGTTYALQFIRAEFYVSRDTIMDSEDVYMGYQLISRLDAQAESSGTVNFYMPSGYNNGLSYFFVKVSSQGDENPNNDTQYRTIYVKPPDVDLTTGPAQLNPKEVLPGHNVNIYFWISNRGIDDISGSFKVKYFFSNDTVFDASDRYLGEEYLSYLAGNTTHSESVNVLAPIVDPGTYYILFIADSEDYVSETNEGNNTYFVPLYIINQGTFPDYYIENVHYQHDRVKNTIKVNFSVLNQGTLGGGSVTSCKFFLSSNEFLDENDQYLGEVSIDKISSEGELSYSFEGVIPHRESNYLIFVVDMDELIEDGNMYNNIYTLVLDFDVPYDLDLNGDIIPGEIHPGDSIIITTQIIQQGSPWLDSVRISYYIGRDSILEFAEKPILEKMLTLSGGEITFDHFSYTMPETADEGQWYGMVYLNWDSVWIEQTSANNFIFLPFDITRNTDHIGPNESNSLAIKLFPNPARDYIIVESPVMVEAYSLSDINGRVLDNGKPMNTEVRIALEAFLPGHYQLVVDTQNGREILRFVIH